MGRLTTIVAGTTGQLRAGVIRINPVGIVVRFVGVGEGRLPTAVKKVSKFHNKWKDWEIEILIEKKSQGLTYAEIAKFLPDRKPQSIQEKARTHPKVKTLKGASIYTTEEESLLVTMVQQGRSYLEIAKRLKRSNEAIKQKAFKMGLAEKAAEIWTDEDDALLIKEAEKGEQLSNLLPLFPGRSLQSLQYRCFLKGIKVKEFQKAKLRARKSKKCKLCKKIKKVEDYYIDTRNQLPGSNCKPCHYKLSRKYELENPEQVRARRAKWVAKNAKRLKEYFSNRYYDNLEKERAVRRLWREKNKDYKRAKDKEYYHKNKEKIRRYFNETWKPKNLQKLLDDKRRHYNENRDAILASQADRKKQIQREKTDQLIKFYKEHEVPEYKWHKSEFALEEDLQSALAHVLVSKFELNAELEVVLNEIGRPDIYLPELDLFLEIKLTSYKWSKKHIVEQVAKYNEISETWIVCLDEAPEWAIETSIPWFTPDGLFDLLSDFRSAH